MRAAAILPGLALLAACERDLPPQHRIPGADVARGRALVAEVGCGACHVVPGVAGPAGAVGPPLDDFGRRALIAGIAPNRPDTLVRWLMDPPSLSPGTAMPALGLSEAQARDVAAFLYTLR